MRLPRLIPCLAVVGAVAIGVAVGNGRPIGPPRLGAAGTAPTTAITRVPTSRRLVALTFDDGPDIRWTPRVIALLARYRAHATFFAVGKNALAHPELITAELAQGSEIGDHTYDHPDLRLLTGRAIRAEVDGGARAIVAVGAPAPTLFRPPFGHTDDRVGGIASSGGYRTIMWNLSVEHLVNHVPRVADGVRDLLRRVRPGTVILAHDGGVPNRTRTMDALPGLLEGLRSMGYQVVDVTELLDAGTNGRLQARRAREAQAVGRRPGRAGTRELISVRPSA